MEFRIYIFATIPLLLLVNVITVQGDTNKRMLQNSDELDTTKREETRNIAKRDASVGDEDSELEEIALKSSLAAQSSTGSHGKAFKAIRGNCRKYGYSETRYEWRPLWYIDMQSIHLVVKVSFGLQSSIYARRFREAILKSEVDTPSFRSRTLDKMCGRFRGRGKPKQEISVYCGERGRYVVVILDLKQILQMCKMKIYKDPNADDEKRIQINPQSARQISTYNGKNAERAITGKCDENGYSATHWTRFPIWYVDLHKQYRVTKVVIGTRRHRKAVRFRTVFIEMHNDRPSFYIRIRGKYYDGCGYYGGPAKKAEVITIYCGKTGRFMSVKIANYGRFSSIEMCAMKIYGIDKTPPPEKNSSSSDSTSVRPCAQENTLSSVADTGPPVQADTGPTVQADTGPSVQGDNGPPVQGDTGPPTSGNTAPGSSSGSSEGETADSGRSRPQSAERNWEYSYGGDVPDDMSLPVEGGNNVHGGDYSYDSGGGNGQQNLESQADYNDEKEVEAMSFGCLLKESALIIYISITAVIGGYCLLVH